MKRILLLVIFVLLFSPPGAFAQGGDSLETAISLYKAGNYETCIISMNNVVKEDPSDSLAYYYLGLSYAKKNQRDLAIKNYDKVIALSSDKTLKNLAKQGKIALGGVSMTACDAPLTSTVEENIPDSNLKDHVRWPAESKIKSDAVVSKPKTPQLNKNGQKSPTNDEIVQAIRVLQKAGLYSPMGLVPGATNNNMNPKVDSKLLQEQMLMQALNSNQNQQNNNNPMAALMGMGNGNNNNNNNNMMNMLPYLNQKGGNPQVNQQFLQTMMMSQMMPNFDSLSNENKDY